MESRKVYISLEPKCKEKTLFYGIKEKACFHSERILELDEQEESEETAEEAEEERGEKEHSDLDDSDYI